MGSSQDDVQLKDFQNIFRLDGKVAVVTGGSRGLGLHAASGLLQAGCSKVFITSRKAKACEDACAALNALPNKHPSAKAIPVPADSSKVAEIERLVAEVARHTDRVDILLANAGATWGEAFDTHPDSAFAKVMDLNVKSVFYTIQKFAPLLTRAASPPHSPSRVLITGSIAGIAPGETNSPNSTPAYSVSKAAALHLARNLALELGPRGILVNGIAPGFFPTKMANGLMEASGGRDKLARANPNGRLGEPEDFAAVVVWLCGRGAGHVNGETVVVDGGKVWQRAAL